MKNVFLTSFMALFLATAAGSRLGAQGEDPCILTDWDTVVNGSAIEVQSPQGVCEYEVDIDSVTYVQADVSLGGDETESYPVRIVVDFTGLNFMQSGNFSLMSFQTSSPPEFMFALNLRWSGFPRNGFRQITLEGSWLPVMPGEPQSDEFNAMTRSFTLDESDFWWTDIQMFLFQSSGPGVSDGRVEMWVDGVLAAEWSNLVLNWTQFRPLESVRFGVIEVFDPNSSGLLRFSPIKPSPYAADTGGL